MMPASSGNSPERPWIVVGNPKDRRIAFFQRALLARSLPAAAVVSWLDLIAGKSLPVGRDSVFAIRVESPGEDLAVQQALIQSGGSNESGEPTIGALQPGQIAHGDRWFRGFRRQLERLAATWPQAQWMNHPSDIACMFDKPRCQQLLQQHGIPTAKSLSVVYQYGQLRQRMREHATGRVFLKPPFGSSASGVIALEVGGNHIRAQTSVEIERSGDGIRLFNSLKMRTYTREDDVAAIVDILGSQGGLMVQRWLPKAGFDRRAVDLRIVVIDAVPRQMVLRSSRSPITNLHLGNQRGDINRFWYTLPLSTREEIAASCSRVAAAFPRSLYLGLDVLVTPGLKKHAVIEVNAFGDLLPGVLDRFQDTYEAELEAAIGRQSAKAAGNCRS